jgi:hypothetical protein
MLDFILGVGLTLFALIFVGLFLINFLIWLATKKD